MAKPRSVYRCTECGHEHPKWAGRCEGCGAWLLLDMPLKRAAIFVGGAVVRYSDDGEGGAPRLVISREVGPHLGLEG